MNNVGKWMLASACFIVGLSLLIGAVVMCTGCGAAMPSAVQQADLTAYSADQLLCVNNAATKAQADACRDAVKEIWCGDGGALAEAGACDSVTLSDGGRP